jgi:hypothetical protein
VETPPQHGTIHGSGRRKGRRRRKENGSHYGLPASCRPIHHGLPTRTTRGTCGSGGIRVLHANDANRGWYEFAGAGNTSSVRNLDVDKVGAADSRAGAVIIIVITFVERIKRQDTRKYMGLSSLANGLSINQRGM